MGDRSLGGELVHLASAASAADESDAAPGAAFSLTAASFAFAALSVTAASVAVAAHADAASEQR